MNRYAHERLNPSVPRCGKAPKSQRFLVKSRRLAWVSAAAAVMLLAAVLLVTAADLREAYGDGPPHYGLTTNMDKWESPVWFLVALNVAVLVVVGLLTRFAWQLWRGPRGAEE